MRLVLQYAALTPRPLVRPFINRAGPSSAPRYRPSSPCPNISTMLDHDDQTRAGDEPEEADVASATSSASNSDDDFDGSTAGSGSDDAPTATVEAPAVPAVVAGAKEVEKPEVEKDVEHLDVDDDPRLWTARKKNLTLAYICYCSLSGATLANI